MREIKGIVLSLVFMFSIITIVSASMIDNTKSIKNGVNKVFVSKTDNKINIWSVKF
jgi:hypothetical protein